MRGKLWFLGGAAVGFVIGARAGRERYDQLTRAARGLWDHPTTQEAAGVVQEQASRLYTRGKETVGDRLGHTRVGQKFGHDGPTGPEVASGAPGIPGTAPEPGRPRPTGRPEPDPLTGATGTAGTGAAGTTGQPPDTAT
jgi:hypothetical protein